MTPPRKWPNNMLAYRDRSAMAAAEGIKALQPIVKGRTYTELEQYRRISKALDSLQEVARLLTAAGANLEPMLENDIERLR